MCFKNMQDSAELCIFRGDVGSSAYTFKTPTNTGFRSLFGFTNEKSGAK